jgi:hypothetical protein
MSWSNTVILMIWALAATPLYSNTTGRLTRIPDQEQPVVLPRAPAYHAFNELINLPGLAVPVVSPNQPPVKFKEIPSAQRPAVPHLSGEWATDRGVEIDIAPWVWNKQRHVWPNPFYKYDPPENEPTMLPEPPQGDFHPRSFIEVVPGKTDQEEAVQGLCVEPKYGPSRMSDRRLK